MPIETFRAKAQSRKQNTFYTSRLNAFMPLRLSAFARTYFLSIAKKQICDFSP
jgi:hypothetical protein